MNENSSNKIIPPSIDDIKVIRLATDNGMGDDEGGISEVFPPRESEATSRIIIGGFYSTINALAKTLPIDKQALSEFVYNKSVDPMIKQSNKEALVSHAYGVNLEIKNGTHNIPDQSLEWGNLPKAEFDPDYALSPSRDMRLAPRPPKAQ